MKFVVVASPEFSHPVKVMVPVDGGHEEQVFRARFRMLPVDEEGAFDLRTAEGSTNFLRAIVVGMEELIGGDNQPISYNDSVRDQLLRWPNVRAALTATYYGAIGKAAQGN